MPGTGKILIKEELEKVNKKLQLEIEVHVLAEEKLKKHCEHLEELVKERTAELDRLKSVFLSSSMSHKLKTPLNSIIGFTGMILMGMTGEITEEQRNHLFIVKDSANHLLSLIEDILDISRIEAGKVELSPGEFRLDEVISEVVETISPAINEKGLKLIREVTEGITVFSDKRRIKQVLINLLSNAVKVTDSGKITLTAGLSESSKLKAQRKSGSFQLSASDFELHRDWLVISVRDTGIGIKSENMNKLFQPFQQIDTPPGKTHNGTGLGLHLCKKLVPLLGGDISAKSEYGSGSEFIFIIPLKVEQKNENSNC
ncbi:MAG: hypothetical protein IMF11_18890 [Proteobacteria bacterium]|nr:hypothetical protein [Pseudomonadota bacterium]